MGYETAADENKPSFEDLEDIARFIQQKTSVRPTLGVICGSGLGGLAEDLDQDRPKDVFSYSEIPNFPVCRGWSSAVFYSSSYMHMDECIVPKLTLLVDVCFNCTATAPFNYVFQ